MKRVTASLLTVAFMTLTGIQSLNAGNGIDPASLPAPLGSPAQMKGIPSAAAGKTPSAAPLSAGRTGGLSGKKPTGRASALSPDARLAEVRNRLDMMAAARRAGLGQIPDLGRLGSPRAVDDFARLQASAGSSFEFFWRDETGTPGFLAGKDLDGPDVVPSGADPLASARRFLDRNRALLQIEDPSSEMSFRKVERDAEGRTAVRFDQTIHSIPVWAHDVVVRFDPAGRAIGFSGYYRATPDVPEPRPLIDAAAAERGAVGLLREKAGVEAGITAAGLVYYPVDGTLRLAWHHTATAGLAWRGDVFTDAATGGYLHHIKDVPTDGPAAGSGIDLSNTNRSLDLFNIGSDFFMINTTKPMFNAAGSMFPNDPIGTINVFNAQNSDGSMLFHTTSSNANNWPNLKNAVSAAFNAGRVFDYFSTRHARNSIDGNGGSMLLVVNFQQNFDNAFWNGQFMVFGNGNGANFSDLAGSLDVTAHEMSHGVVEHTANLVYEFQPGALNEHFADAFGVSCDFFINPGSANFLLGEEVTTPNIAGDALRDMENPGAPNVAFGGQQPGHMNAFQNLPKDSDNGGVHINSGIPNHAFFFTVSAIGIEKAEKIWYRALSQHLTRNSQFIDFRLATMQAAEELFGGVERAAVASAMACVGILGNTGTPPPPPPPDNAGSDFVSVIDAETDGHIYRVPPDLSADFEDISGLEAAPSGRPSFSDDGGLYAFVASDGNVYLGNYQQVMPLSDTGGWWSVALSADGTHLAATTVEEDGKIFVFDITQPGHDAVYNLSTPNSSTGETPDVVVFADVMEFSVQPGFLIYDALNRTQLAGSTYEYWEINLLRLEDGEPFRVFPPLPPGESIGNPTFAQNSDNRIAFDYAAADGNIYGVGFDFQSGAQGIITNNLQSITRPAFSGDDSEVFYMFTDNQGSVVYRVGLAGDGVTGTGNDAIWVTGGHSPVWITIGERPTPALLTALDGAWTPEGVSLTWRVADASGFAGFLVARSVTEDDMFEPRTPRPITESDGGLFSFEDTPPDAGIARYRLEGLTRAGDVIELGRITLRPSGSPPARARITASPNPFRAGSRIAYRLPDVSEPPRITIHDVSGRLVTELTPPEILADEGFVEWSGQDATGRPVPAGNYFVKLTGKSYAATARVVRIP